MESSTFKRIIRVAITLIALLAWQFVATPFVFYMMAQSDGRDMQYYDGYGNLEHHGLTIFTYHYETVADGFWRIVGAEVGGAALTAVIVGLLFGIYALLRLAAKGFADNAEYPPCQNPNCPCVLHTGEVFADGKWDDKKCTDPKCPCVNWHAGEKFDFENNEWVDA